MKYVEETSDCIKGVATSVGTCVGTRVGTRVVMCVGGSGGARASVGAQLFSTLGYTVRRIRTVYAHMPVCIYIYIYIYIRICTYMYICVY